jgi:hypothetical protein
MERWVQIGAVLKDIKCDYTYTMIISLPMFYGGGSLAYLEDEGHSSSLIMDWEHMTFRNYSTFYNGQYNRLVTGQITFANNENIPNKFSTITFDPHLSWGVYGEAYFYQNWDSVWFGDYTSPDKNHPFWYSDAVREKLQELHIQWNLPVNQFAVLHTDEADFTNSTMYFVVFPYSE